MTRADILSMAGTCISSDRAATYGDARAGFGAIADIWAALDRARGARRRGPADVAAYMIAVKLVRAATSPGHLDSWVDIAGYAALGGEFAAEGGEA